MEGETELEMIRRHIREGEGVLKRQGELLARLRERGAPTDLATTLQCAEGGGQAAASALAGPPL